MRLSDSEETSDSLVCGLVCGVAVRSGDRQVRDGMAAAAGQPGLPVRYLMLSGAGGVPMMSVPPRGTMDGPFLGDGKSRPRFLVALRRALTAGHLAVRGPIRGRQRRRDRHYLLLVLLVFLRRQRARACRAVSTPRRDEAFRNRKDRTSRGEEVEKGGLAGGWGGSSGMTT